MVNQAARQSRCSSSTELSLPFGAPIRSYALYRVSGVPHPVRPGSPFVGSREGPTTGLRTERCRCSLANNAPAHLGSTTNAV